MLNEKNIPCILYLANITFLRDDVKRIICKLDPNKAHGHDRISSRVGQVCSINILWIFRQVFSPTIVFHVCAAMLTWSSLVRMSQSWHPVIVFYPRI